MGSDPRKKKQPPNVMRMLTIVQMRWEDMFPDTDRYSNSLWATWVSRIRAGHDKEEELAAENVKRWDSELTAEQKQWMPDDLFADEFWGIEQVTNNMYAALIVSLWACVEGSLKDLLSVCKGTKDSNKLCPVHSSGVKTITQGFKKELNIKLEEQLSYPVVNAVRILCNSFKHSEGFYEPKGSDSHSQINPDLLTKWKCISDRFKDRKAIDYDRLPIQELVFTCGTFFEGLLEQIKKKLEGLGYGD